MIRAIGWVGLAASVLWMFAIAEPAGFPHYPHKPFPPLIDASLGSPSDYLTTGSTVTTPPFTMTAVPACNAMAVIISGKLAVPGTQITCAR